MSAWSFPERSKYRHFWSAILEGVKIEFASEQVPRRLCRNSFLNRKVRSILKFSIFAYNSNFMGCLKIFWEFYKIKILARHRTAQWLSNSAQVYDEDWKRKRAYCVLLADHRRRKPKKSSAILRNCIVFWLV